MNRIAQTVGVVLATVLAAGAAEPTSAELLKQANKKGAAQRLNLREYDATKALYLKSIACATNAYDKAVATIDYARYEWRCAKDDQPEKWREMERDAWKAALAAKIPAELRYELLKKGVAGLDWKVEADKIFAEFPKTGHQYWNGLLAHPPSVFSGTDWTLEVCEKALADEKLTINRWVWEDQKVAALVKLGREKDALAFCDAGLAASKKDGKKPTEWMCRKAGVLAKLSAHYYDTRDPKLAREAIALYREALASGAAAQIRRTVIDLAIDIGDLGIAGEELKALAAAEKTPSDWVLTRKGDVAYLTGDFAASVDAYKAAKKIEVGEDKNRLSCRRYAEALYALGRYDEALKAIDGMANWMSNRDINDNYRKAIKKMIAAGGKPADADELVPVRKPYDPKRFRLMCYNIRVGAGAETWNAAFKPGELRALPRVARTIRESQADYACLQEVNQLAAETGGIDQPAYLAGETGLVATYREKVSRGQGSYGLAMLSPVQPLASRLVYLPQGKDHKRICLISEFEGFVLATAHFSGDRDVQRKSADLVVSELSKYEKPVLFCGDLNALPESETIAALGKHFKLLSDPSVKTCHALSPDICLDYIFVDRAHADSVKASGYTVGDSTASDHLPIWVDVEL